ncbi:MAG: phosphoribosylformylglycinamidine synthase [Deltaproteobacteria bacterium]|nr:phosphoribosylformylglycinamidine synthase [Deltaproteobacteria bacterium]
MTTRIEVELQPQIADPHGESIRWRAENYLGIELESVRTRTIYKLDGKINAAHASAIRDALTDPVIERSAIGRLDLPRCDWLITVGFRPGVTDNVGRTARRFVADLLCTPLDAVAEVFTETQYLVAAPTIDRPTAERVAAELLANPIIQRIEVNAAHAYRDQPIDLSVPRAGSDSKAHVATITLDEDPAALLALSQRRQLALNSDEMVAIRNYYAQPEVCARRQARGLPSSPTDVELEVLAQTWSEHCKHKIFAATIRYEDRAGNTEVIDSLFKTYIVKTTKQVGERIDWLVSVFHDNAGIVRLDADWNLVYKVETHNSPSALDPYGGAITGIVGVNRDPLGTGRGAALLTNVWGYCFGPPDYRGPLPGGLQPPRRIRDGVHQGVIDGGNQSGIPYSRGWELFDPRFIGKPLVFCGTVGLIPARIEGIPSEHKEIAPDDHIVMVGGRIGKDGIHGATFSSDALDGQVSSQAVQIGDPITQKTMADMLLEARDAGLYRTLTDNGAGGLSSSVGEIAQLAGGAELWLDRAPLKYPGLDPWEILLSEAQERMTLAVPDKQLEAFLELARRREVEATVIGRFANSGQLTVCYGERIVAELPLSFLHDGCPTMQLSAIEPVARGVEPSEAGIALDFEKPQQLLSDMIGYFNLCAKSKTARRYDHEVKGLSVIKPLLGVYGDVPADASAMRVRHGADAGILLAEGALPYLADIDAGAMAAACVDLAVRRIVAAGGRLGRIAALDNFCWPDPILSDKTPDGPEKLGALVRCCRSLAAACIELDLPLISGKDSMKNDAILDGVKISIPPTLLFSAIAWVDDVSKLRDLVIPCGDHQLYLLGDAAAEALGGSELYRTISRRVGREITGRQAPVIDPTRTRTVCEALTEIADRGWISAAHAPQLGGVALGLAQMSLAANRGLDIQLPAAPNTLAALFAEGGSRFLLATSDDNANALERWAATQAIPLIRIGRTAQDPDLRIACGEARIELPLETLRQLFHQKDL